MSGETHKYHLTVLEHHLDSYGHVNNATYIQMFEEARWDMITKHGYGWDKVHQSKIGPVVLGLEVKFKAELRLREKITIETRLADYSGKVGRLHQVLRKEDGSDSADAMFTFGLFDLKARKLIPPTPEWKAAVGILD